jgi:hypothetical protein
MLASARVRGFQRKLSAFRHLSPVIAAPFVTMANLSLLVLLVLKPAWALPLLAMTGFMFVLGFAALVFGLAVGQRTVRSSLPQHFMARCLHVLFLQLRMGWVLTYRSTLEAFGGKHVEFVRTPKRGGLHSREPDKVA